MSAYQTKFHRDGSVTVWNVFTQQWERRQAADLVRDADEPFGNVVLPTLPRDERDRVIRMARAGK